MINKTLTILCTNSICKFNKCCGYYGICNHPNRYQSTYGGIDRSYTDGCKLYEKRGNKNEQ